MAAPRKAGAPLKPGDVLTPSPLYRFVPLGVLSLAVYGLLVLAPVFVILGLLKDPDAVVSSFGGDGLGTWLVCIVVWLGLLALNPALGTLMSRRRLVIETGWITVRKALGGETRVSAREATEIRTVYSTAGLIQGVIRLKYRDGSRAVLDGSGFDSRDLERVATYIAKGADRRTQGLIEREISAG